MGEPRGETSKVFDAIFDFNEQVIGLPEQIAVNCLTEKQYDWHVAFCAEEMGELAVAFEEQDVVAMVDAIMDLVYGMFGAIKKMGLTREQAFACMMAVHRANMTKKRGVVARRGSDEDAVKPEDFVPPETTIGRILFGDEGLTRKEQT